MTTDSNHNEPRVSEAYRSIATETTPPELDQRILSMAAGRSRSRYGLARAWIRPVAWAATIGLSLAFVLEMSQIGDIATPEADLVESLEERIVRDEEPARAKEDNRMQGETAKRSDAPAPAQLSMPAAKQASSPPGPTRPEPKSESGLATDSASVSADFEADDMSMLHQAEEQARARSGSERSSVPPASALQFDAAVAAETKEPIEHCDPDARSSVEAWYACIEGLRDDGLSDAADQELIALLIEFPKFEVPEQNR